MPITSAMGAQVATLAALLQARRATLATAESCTGGWVAKALTDRPGSSAWFMGGIVCYSNQAKQDLLGVPAAMLAEHGAVSEPVVQVLAAEARRRLGASLAVSISGIAGPGGGSADKPVGLVWFGWDDVSGSSTESRVFEGGREAVREQSVRHALAGCIARAESMAQCADY
ncbi:CinA family protein [Abyssibacter profundi]|uniref:Damage-inducible protein CinA n=1 Tax=Abyssibacter profundi TaxID=2182787 RepID=A0A363UMS5_9GAMM|nr:CinA family protein [Abyssibacter profundi]MBV60721.1 damage-inducible protein CinA [Nevskiales bacterium]PWN56710.1 damage-inducible protein CinA [Abyssibacter profundi]